MGRTPRPALLNPEPDEQLREFFRGDPVGDRIHFGIDGSEADIDYPVGIPKVGKQVRGGLNRVIESTRLIIVAATVAIGG
jgi:hypothetical protein